MFAESGGFGHCLAGQPAPPRRGVWAEGAVWIAFKAIWGGPRGCVCRRCWASWPLASGPLGTGGLHLVALVLLPPPRGPCRGWGGCPAGRAERCQVPIRSPASAFSGQRESWWHGGAGQRLPWAPGTETRSPSRAHCQGHDFYALNTGFLHVRVKTHAYQKLLLAFSGIIESRILLFWFFI